MGLVPEGHDVLVLVVLPHEEGLDDSLDVEGGVVGVVLEPAQELGLVRIE